MHKVQRFDRGELTPARKTPEGYLMFEARATRAGVFLYRDGNGGIRRELRPPEEVGNPESLATLARKPVTNLHPFQFVDSNNVDAHGVGTLDGEVVWEEDFEDGFVRVRGIVQKQDAVTDIEAGRQEVSAGYTAELEESSGIWTDSEGRQHPFDAIQRNIRYNHLAVVDRGRAGAKARLRIDGAAIQITDQDDTPPPPPGDTPMEKIRIDGQEYNADELGPIQRAIAALVEQRDTERTQKEDAEGRLAAAEIELVDARKKTEEQKGRADTAESELERVKKERKDHAPDEATLLAYSQERAALLAFANEVKLDGADELNNGELKRAIVLTRFDEEDLESDAHLAAAFKLMSKDRARRSDDIEELANNVTGGGRGTPGSRTRTDGQKALDAAQAEYLKRMTSLSSEG